MNSRIYLSIVLFTHAVCSIIVIASESMFTVIKETEIEFNII